MTFHCLYYHMSCLSCRHGACTQVGKGNVHTALSLVGYEQQLVKVMEFVFGNAFVCSDMDSAKQVTFNDAVMKRSVTLEGDSFDPAGTLTGGKSALMERSLEVKLL